MSFVVDLIIDDSILPSQGIKKILEWVKKDPHCINWLNHQGIAPIHAAILENKLDYLKTLLDLNAGLDFNAPNRMSLVQLIFCFGSFSALEALFSTSRFKLNVLYKGFNLADLYLIRRHVESIPFFQDNDDALFNKFLKENNIRATIQPGANASDPYYYSMMIEKPTIEKSEQAWGNDELDCKIEEAFLSLQKTINELESQSLTHESSSFFDIKNISNLQLPPSAYFDDEKEEKEEKCQIIFRRARK